MAVGLARGALSYLKGNDGNLCLQLRTPDETGRAVAALEAASRVIAEIRSAEEPDGPAASYISEPLRLPDGPALTIDMADEPARVLRQVADVIVAEAEAAGVTDGEVGPPKKATGHPYWGDQHGEVPGAFYPQLLLRAQKFTGVRPSIPSDWVEPILDWLLDGVPPTVDIWAAIGTLPFSVPARAVKELLSPPAGGSLLFMTGDDSMRLLRFSAISWDAVLSFAGSEMDQPDADIAIEKLRDLARVLAPSLDYSALDYRRMGSSGQLGYRHGISAAIHRGTAPSWPRLLIPDVFCWQLLSPEHICLLGQPPPGSRRLPADRFEVPFGDLREWDEGSARQIELRRQALAALHPLLHDSHPHMVWVRRKQNDWGTLDQIQTRIEEALPGGTWVHPLVYDRRGLDHPIQIRIDRYLENVSLYPAGPLAAAHARRIAQLFPGEVNERPAAPNG